MGDEFWQGCIGGANRAHRRGCGLAVAQQKHAEKIFYDAAAKWQKQKRLAEAGENAPELKALEAEYWRLYDIRCEADFQLLQYLKGALIASLPVTTTDTTDDSVTVERILRTHRLHSDAAVPRCRHRSTPPMADAALGADDPQIVKNQKTQTVADITMN